MKLLVFGFLGIEVFFYIKGFVFQDIFLGYGLLGSIFALFFAFILGRLGGLVIFALVRFFAFFFTLFLALILFLFVEGCLALFNFDLVIDRLVFACL